MAYCSQSDMNMNRSSINCFTPIYGPIPALSSHRQIAQAALNKYPGLCVDISLCRDHCKTRTYTLEKLTDIQTHTKKKQEQQKQQFDYCSCSKDKIEIVVL